MLDACLPGEDALAPDASAARAERPVGIIVLTAAADTIDLRITRLRRKIEVDPAHPEAIRTVRGVGYMFVPPPI
jgi:hypothetical protein